MKRYYIADLHFYHGNMNTRMDKRGFDDADTMNEYMISQWNSKVQAKDEVVILGDFCMSTRAEDANQILSRLKGRKYLIVGNHDRYLNKPGFNRDNFKWVSDYKELNDNGRKVILSHYPIMCYNGQYRLDESGNPKTYMLYGHVHNTFDEQLINEYLANVRKNPSHAYGHDKGTPFPCNMINCFCMFSDYIPLTLDEWIVNDQERRKRLKLSDQ